MNSSKSSISTILFAVATLLFVFAIFCMFGPVVSHEGLAADNMFQSAFGAGGIGFSRVSGLTAVFVFQMIIMICAFTIIWGVITHKLHHILVIILYSLMCLCSVIALIISFNAKGLWCNVNNNGDVFEYSLGVGPIMYSIFHMLALFLSATGLVTSRRG
ncbi:MAG: hypothetical protein MJ208_03175 [Bacilli bacterium]|nr:hypothetical protein [Bacilli bacterium]